LYPYFDHLKRAKSNICEHLSGGRTCAPYERLVFLIAFLAESIGIGVFEELVETIFECSL